MGVATPTALPPLAAQLPGTESTGIARSWMGSGPVRAVQALGASSVDAVLEQPRLEKTPMAGDATVHCPPVGAAQLHGAQPRASLTPV